MFRFSNFHVLSFFATFLLFGNLALAQNIPDQALIDKAREQGSVRVILQLNTDFTAEGKLPDAASVGQQRADIASAQGRIISSLRSNLASVVARFETIPNLALEVDADALRQLYDLADVASVAEDVPSPIAMAESNAIIGSAAAWSSGYTGAGQTVAILDTGVDKTHPFFKTSDGNKIVSEACYSSTDSGYASLSVCPGGVDSTATGSGIDCTAAAAGYSDAQDDCAHGTHVAGTAAGDDGIGPDYGVAPDADIIAIQIFSLFTTSANCVSQTSCMLSYPSDQINALERVYELRDSFNISSVNMSIGGEAYTNACDSVSVGRKNAIDNLRSVGIATVIASGNEGYTNAISSPACLSSAISVGATNDDDQVAWFSNVADFLDLFSPGVSITSSVPGGGKATWSGTSMATPHVTGAWAVLKQALPTGTVEEILEALKTTGTLIDDQRNGDSERDIPRINVGLALESLLPSTSVIEFEFSGYSVNEGDGAITLNVSRSGNLQGSASVYFSTVNGTAEDNSDYIPNQGILDWSDGDGSSKTISIAITDDSTIENDESFSVELSNPSNSDLGGNFDSVVTIIDNDSIPPAIPTGVTFTNSADGTATISWATIENATHYDVQREKRHKKRVNVWNELTIVASGIQDADPTTTDVVEFSDSSGAGIFRWQVRSNNEGGSSDWSAWVVGEVTDTAGGGGRGDFCDSHPNHKRCQ